MMYIYCGVMVSMHVTNVEDSGFPLSSHTKDYNFDIWCFFCQTRNELLNKNIVDFLLLERIQWRRNRWSRRWHEFRPIRTNSSLQRIKGKVRVCDISFCLLVCKKIVMSYCLNNLFYVNICQLLCFLILLTAIFLTRHWNLSLSFMTIICQTYSRII